MIISLTSTSPIDLDVSLGGTIDFTSGGVASTASLSVDWNTVAGSATAGDDFQSASGTVGFAIDRRSRGHFTRIGIDRTEQSLSAGVVQFVHHRMTGQRCMVGLDVQFESFGKIVGSQEVDASGRI